MNNGYKKPDLKSLYYDNEMEAIPSLNGKTIVITGTTSGTGFIAAKTVANKGARTLLLNRKSDRSESSFDQIKEACPGANILNVECDLQSFESVNKAAETVIDKCKDGLDILVWFTILASPLFCSAFWSDGNNFFVSKKCDR